MANGLGCGADEIYNLNSHDMHKEFDTMYEPSSSGAANMIIPSSSDVGPFVVPKGSFSGTPPTRVLTTYSPAHAASRIAIPKDSVRDVFKKI